MAVLSFQPIVEVCRQEFQAGHITCPRLLSECLDSAALTHVTLVSLKNIPFAFFSKRWNSDTIYSAVVARVRYLEAGTMALASAVCNCVVALFCAVGVALTWGRVPAAQELCRRFFVHTVLSACAVGVCAVGMVSPLAGIMAQGSVGLVLAKTIWPATEIDCVKMITGIYQRNRVVFRQFGQDVFADRPEIFNREVAPTFDYLDTHLNGRVVTFSDLMCIGRAVVGMQGEAVAEVVRATRGLARVVEVVPEMARQVVAPFIPCM